MKFKMLPLVIFTVIVTILSIYVLDKILVGAIVGFFIVLIFYITPLTIYNLVLMNKWLKVLFDDCDPETFLEMGNNYLEHKRFNPLLIKLNLSAGLIELGEYEAANNLLLSLDLNQFEFKQAGMKLVYYCNLLMSYLGKDQLDEASKIYHNEIKPLPFKNKKQITNLKLIEAIYLFHMEHYEMSKAYLESNLNSTNNRNNYVNMLYFLAQIELKQGLLNQAKEKLAEVIEKGHKLEVAREANELLMELNSKRVVEDVIN